MMQRGFAGAIIGTADDGHERQSGGGAVVAISFNGTQHIHTHIHTQRWSPEGELTR